MSTEAHKRLERFRSIAALADDHRAPDGERLAAMAMLDKLLRDARNVTLGDAAIAAFEIGKRPTTTPPPTPTATRAHWPWQRPQRQPPPKPEPWQPQRDITELSGVAPDILRAVMARRSPVTADEKADLRIISSVLRSQIRMHGIPVPKGTAQFLQGVESEHAGTRWRRQQLHRLAEIETFVADYLSGAST